MYSNKNDLEEENGFTFNDDDDIVVVKMEEPDGNDTTLSHDPLETVKPSSDGRLKIDYFTDQNVKIAFSL